MSLHPSGKVHLFQPTLPARGATGWCWHDFRRKEISTHAPRTGSDCLLGAASWLRTTFQPTLPARGATKGDTLGDPGQIISTHAPRTGSDTVEQVEIYDQNGFQPTLPARGATLRAAYSRTRG